MVRNLPVVQETWVQSLGQEDPLEKRMATHSSILAWRIPWTEEPGGLQFMGLQRVRHNWATNTLTNMECVLLIFFLISLNTKHNIGYMVFVQYFHNKNSIADNSIQPQSLPLCHCHSHTTFLKHWSSFNSLLPIPVYMLCPFLIPYKITHSSHITLNNNSFEAFTQPRRLIYMVLLYMLLSYSANILIETIILVLPNYQLHCPVPTKLQTITLFECLPLA